MKIFSILSILFLFGCADNSYRLLEYFEAYNYANWMHVYKLETYNDHYFNKGKEVKKPLGTWQNLLRMELVGEEGKERKIQCLIYKLPNPLGDHRTLGILKVVNVKEDEKCDNVWDKSAEIELEDINSLKIFLSKNKRKIGQGKITLDPYTLVLKVNWGFDRTDKWMLFPFLNLAKRVRLPYMNKRYSPSLKIKKLSGLSFWPEEMSNTKPVKLIGKYTDSYGQNSATLCHKVDDKCQTIGLNTCSRCRYGYFEVVSSKCTKVFNKYCGVNNCGKKGEPACIRGFEYEAGKKFEGGCYNDSKSVYCNKGLNPICDGNQVMICN